MAARLNRRHQASVREKIKTTQLIKRLQAFAFDEIDLSPHQAKTIEYLINQGIGTPAKSVTVSGDAEAPVVHEIVMKPVMPADGG